MPKPKIKYANYEALFIHKKGNRTASGFSFLNEALKRFENSKTAKRMVIYKATHNNTRIKKLKEYTK